MLIYRELKRKCVLKCFKLEICFSQNISYKQKYQKILLSYHVVQQGNCLLKIPNSLFWKLCSVPARIVVQSAAG